MVEIVFYFQLFYNQEFWINQGSNRKGLRARSKLCCHFFQLSFWFRWMGRIGSYNYSSTKGTKKHVNIMFAFFEIKNSHSMQLFHFESNMMSKLDFFTYDEVHFQVKIREGVKKKPRCSSYIYNIFTKYLWMILFNCNIMITGSHLRKHLSSHQLFVVKILIF